MNKKLINLKEIKNLKKRYLIWLYKTTKEQIDKIDRKFTQLDVDKFMLKEITDGVSSFTSNQKDSLNKFLVDFKNYIENKEKEAINLKFDIFGETTTKSEYIFLKLKLEAIEKAVKKIFGKNILQKIKNLYEKEMIKRILEERAHK